MNMIDRGATRPNPILSYAVGNTRCLPNPEAERLRHGVPRARQRERQRRHGDLLPTSPWSRVHGG